MSEKEERLQRLRQRAERALDAMDIAPDMSFSNIEDMVHELRVYYAELEIQLEDLRNANERLTAARERYADLFNFAPVGYVVTDTHGHIEEMNLTAQVLFGIEIKNWYGRMLADLLHTDEREAYHIHMQTVLRTGKVRETDVKVHGADNTVFFARLTTQLPAIASGTRLLYTRSNLFQERSCHELTFTRSDENHDTGQLPTNLKVYFQESYPCRLAATHQRDENRYRSHRGCY